MEWLHKLKYLGLAAITLPGIGKSAEPQHSAEASRPNIVVILADDLGFSDLGCYGSEISTPNLDALAQNGLRFTQFYNTARCCPSRASLLTGLYPHQAGMGYMTKDFSLPAYSGELNRTCVTIPEVLRPAGYATYMTGKWHLSNQEISEDAQKPTWPLQRGFDRYFGFIGGATSYFHPKTLASDNTALPVPGDGFYTTDAFVDRAIEFINGGPTNQPFFLYLAFNAPHAPTQAPVEDVAKYLGKYKTGWDKLRESRYEKLTQLGLIDKKWELSPRRETIKAWDSLTPEEQTRFDQIMATYAACVDHMDQAVGRLIESLRGRNQLDNTLIVFVSDNGGCAEEGPDGKLSAGAAAGGDKSVVFCGESWGSLENTPFRMYKRYNHEGGVATPFIAYWPNGITERGGIRTQPCHLIDIMATCAELAGAKYPEKFNGNPICPMEGKSLLPVFKGNKLDRETLYWEHEGNSAIRDGDWKLVRIGVQGPWELYDMASDRTELHNVAASHPEVVKNLSEKWESWAVRAKVKPYPPRNFWKSK